MPILIRLPVVVLFILPFIIIVRIVPIVVFRQKPGYLDRRLQGFAPLVRTRIFYAFLLSPLQFPGKIAYSGLNFGGKRRLVRIGLSHHLLLFGPFGEFRAKCLRIIKRLIQPRSSAFRRDIVAGVGQTLDDLVHRLRRRDHVLVELRKSPLGGCKIALRIGIEIGKLTRRVNRPLVQLVDIPKNFRLFVLVRYGF